MKVPVWTADYVLGSYGTGAVMAVPAHDERDFAFAKAFDLGVRRVVAPAKGKGEGDEVVEAFTGKGVSVNSGEVGGFGALSVGSRGSGYFCSMLPAIGVRHSTIFALHPAPPLIPSHPPLHTRSLPIPHPTPFHPTPPRPTPG